MKAILKLIILCLVFLNVAKAQVILPMGIGQKNALNVSCSEGDKMWIMSNEDEKFILNKWDGNFWIQYAEIPVTILNTISTLPQSIEVKAVCYFNNDIYLALANKYNEKLLLLKNSGQKWDVINTDNVKAANKLTFLKTTDGLLLCGKITLANQSITILKIKQNACELYAGLSANNSANDYFTDFEYCKDTVWAFGYFTINQESRYFAKLDNGNWIIIPQENAPFINGNIAIGTYQQNLVLAGVDFDGKASFSIQKTNNTWAEMSNGLSEWKINSISDFRQIDQKYWAAGQFINLKTNKNASLAVWDGTTWTVPNFDYLGNDIQLNGKNLVLISGNFISYQGLLLNHTGILDFGNAIIAGKVFYDINDNCIQDFGENNISGVVMQLTPENIYIMTDYNGRYYFPIDNTPKSHFVELILPKYMKATNCGSSGTNGTLKPANISSQLTTAGIDFGLKPSGNHLDAAAQISDYTGWRARQGFEETYNICVVNTGTQKIESGKLTFKADARLTNWVFSDQPLTWQNNTAEWTIKAINASEKYCIKAKTTILMTLPLETEILFDVKINIGDLEDENPSNNASILKQKIVAAIDPNDKKTKQNYLIAPEQKIIDYKIRFQNTGNDIAYNIIVTDELDPNLSIGPLGTITDASHDIETAPTFWRLPNGKWQSKYAWKFNNIRLTDSATNNEESQGYINFTLNLTPSSNLPIGLTLQNQAYIYFDFQEPILTNIATNLVSENVGIYKPLPLNKLSCYPNPVQDYLTINNPLKSSISITIINSLGQVMLTKTIEAESRLSLLTETIPTGLYFLNAQGFAPIKFIIN